MNLYNKWMRNREKYREEMILAMTHYADYLIKRHYGNPDLYSLGHISLIETIDKYKPKSEPHSITELKGWIKYNLMAKCRADKNIYHKNIQGIPFSALDTLNPNYYDGEHDNFEDTIPDDTPPPSLPGLDIENVRDALNNNLSELELKLIYYRYEKELTLAMCARKANLNSPQIADKYIRIALGKIKEHYNNHGVRELHDIIT